MNSALFPGIQARERSDFSFGRIVALCSCIVLQCQEDPVALLLGCPAKGEDKRIAHERLVPEGAEDYRKDFLGEIFSRLAAPRDQVVRSQIGDSLIVPL